MRHHRARPFGQSMTGMRAASMLMALLVVSMLIYRLKDPGMWSAFADEREAEPQAVVVAPAAEPEPVVAGPNDLDEDEVAFMENEYEKIVDRAPLKSREMNVYWRLLKWSRTQSFDELEKRAANDVPFTKLWEQPEKHRGKPIRLRMHVRRINDWDAPEDQREFKKVYEAWGWTDESRSFPYVVAFTDPPAGLPIGTDVRAEVVFVGYFMKVMTYKATDATRGAPFLLGKLHLISKGAEGSAPPFPEWLIPVIVGAAVIGCGFMIWSNMKSRYQPKISSLPRDLGSDAGPTEGDFDFSSLGTAQASGPVITLNSTDRLH